MNATKAIKRLEIIIDESHAKDLTRDLKKAGFPDFTKVPEVHGAGSRGRRSGDHMTGVFHNCLIILACEEANVQKACDIIRPYLSDIGGMCLISDALWLEH